MQSTGRRLYDAPPPSQSHLIGKLNILNTCPNVSVSSTSSTVVEPTSVFTKTFKAAPPAAPTAARKRAVSPCGSCSRSKVDEAVLLSRLVAWLVPGPACPCSVTAAPCPADPDVHPLLDRSHRGPAGSRDQLCWRRRFHNVFSMSSTTHSAVTRQ